jgi:hypothetical protein
MVKSATAVRVWSLIVMTLDRLEEVLGATVKLTVPGPVPLPPDVIVTKLSGSEADHWQRAWVLTWKELLLAAAAIVTLWGTRG